MELEKSISSILMDLKANGVFKENDNGAVDSSLLTEEERLNWIKLFEVPKFVPPFPLQVHDVMDIELWEATRDWLFHHSIDTILQPHMLDKQITTPKLAALVHPNASRNGMDLLCKLTTLSFLIDDLIDDADIETSWKTSSFFVILEINLVMISSFPNETVMLECLMNFVDRFASDQRENIQIQFKHRVNSKSNKRFDGKLSPIASAFRELWDGAIFAMKKEATYRFARYYQMYLIASLIQNQNRRDHIIPSLEDYMFLRKETGGVICFLALVDLLDDVCLPEDIFCSAQMKLLMNIVSDVVVWNNDIWSFQKEYLANEDVHNLVYLISYHFRCSYEVAALVITKMMDAKCVDFELESKELLNLTPLEHQPAVSAYIVACKNWISGSDYFYKKSLRYK